MQGCSVCNICPTPIRLEQATEITRVPCNVRRFKDELFTVWRCPVCLSLHSKEAVDVSYYYEHYPFREHTLDLWARIGYANYLKRLQRVGLARNHLLMDFGCGPGLFVTFLHEHGYQAVGYDKHVPQFADPSALNKSYDFIVAQDIIEHVDDPKELLMELKARLRPGGILCIGTPNAEGISLSDPESYALSLHQPYHRHILSERALRSLAHDQNLEVMALYHRYYYDTLYPSVNYRFLQTYVKKAGNVLDVAFEPPKIALVLTSPILWVWALLGYFYPPRSEMTIIFRRRL